MKILNPVERGNWIKPLICEWPRGSSQVMAVPVGVSE